MPEFNPTAGVSTHQVRARKRSFKAILKSHNSVFHTLIEKLAWRRISIVTLTGIISLLVIFLTIQLEDLHLKILQKNPSLESFQCRDSPQMDYLIQCISWQDFPPEK